jgi:prevent-host-death family protein
VFRTYSAREFNRDTASAKRAAEDGPVYVTDRGRPSHVLLSIVEYERLVAAGAAAAAGDPAGGSTTRPPTLLDLLGSDPAVADVDLPLERFDDVPAPIDLDQLLD